MEYPQVIEVSEISEQTVQSIRIVLIQSSDSRFILLIEALKAPDYKTFHQISTAKQIHGKERALSEYNFMIHQLRQIHYAD
jgi:hypothetical protein